MDKDRRIEVEMVVMVCYGSLGGSRPVDGGLGAVGGQLVRGGRVGWVMGWVGGGLAVGSSFRAGGWGWGETDAHQ